MPHCSQPSVDGGYDCVFIDRKFAEYYECTICSKVFRNPFLAVCCGKHYCKVCIKKWRKEKTACPHCGNDGFKVVINRGKVREVKALRVYCTNSRQQREANGYRREWGDRREGSVCPLIYVKCVLAPIGCNGEFKRKNMSRHMRKHQMVHGKLETR